VTDDPAPARFSVRFTPAAERELQRLPADGAARLRRPILGLALDPHPPGSARIAGSSHRRLRIGDLRVVSGVQDVERVVIIVRVARRSESTYRQLPR
jgi:mRNA interferase RelE/StbE